ncbi:MAG: hypothetical protein LBR79_00715 [Oscillospiraceae bacterium]|nr:hypothetical protein [Oscillospiraceae bacterium]
MIWSLNRENYGIIDLLNIVRVLRSSDGCLGDRIQTHSSLRSSFIESVHGASECIDCGDMNSFKEKLAEVLKCIIFHCQIEQEFNNFSFDDVIDDACKKLILKHPHIFLKGVQENILKESNQFNLNNKVRFLNVKRPVEPSEEIPKTLPALARAKKIQSKAAREGYGVFSIDEALSEIKNRLRSLENAIKNGEINKYSKKMGDFLFSVSEISKLIDVDAESSLYDSCQRFMNNFMHTLEIQNRV